MNTTEDSTNPPEPHRSKAGGPLRRLLGVVAWCAISLVGVLTVGFVTLLVSVNLDGVHRYLLGLAQRQASSTLGVQVKLQNFTLHLSNLSLDLYGIRVAGAGPHSDPPLLQVSHVEVSLRIISIFRRQWYLNSLRIDRPVAWIVVDKSGASNLPRLKSGGGGSTNIFTLGIRHILLDRGEIYYNSRPSAVAADLHDLLLRGSFDNLRQNYSCNLSYTHGRLIYRAYKPIEHDLFVKFDVTPSAFHLTQARLSSGASQAVLSGVVENYASRPQIHANYAVTVDGSQIAALLQQPLLPAGILRTSGSLSYRSEPGRAPLETIAINGMLASSRLRFEMSKAHAALTGLVAHYSLANGDATLSDLRASALGGQLDVQGAMKNLTGDTHSRFNAALHGISLNALQSVLAPFAPMAGLRISGAVNATTNVSWGKTLSDLTAQANVAVNGEVTNRQAVQKQRAQQVKAASGAGVPGAIPVNSVIHAAYNNRSRTLELTNTYLSAAQTDLNLNGTVGKSSELAVHLEAKNLRELAAMVDAFRSSASATPPLDLAGAASFQGTVRGPALAPQIAGQLAAENLRVDQTSWKILRAHLEAGPSGVSLWQGELESASQGRVSFSTSADLKNWKFSDSSQFKIELAASRVRLADLVQLSGTPMPVAGNLSASVNFHGSELNPEGSGELALTNFSAYHQPIQSVKANFSATGKQLEADLLVHLLSGNMKANVTVQPGQRTYTAQVTSSGVRIGQLQLLKERGIHVSGVLALNVSGQGSFSDPQFSGGIQIPSLTVEEQTVSGLKVQMNLTHHVASAALVSSAFETRVEAKARVNLGGDYLTEASLDTGVIQIQPLVALYAPDEAAGLTGQTEIHATLQGPLKDEKALQARVTVPVLKLAYGAFHIAAASPIQGDYANEVFNLLPVSIRGTGTDLQLQATVPAATNAPMSLKVHGAIDLQLAQLFAPDVSSSGQILIDIDSHGPIAQGNFGGEIDIVNASFASANSPVGLQDGNGVLKLSTNRLVISKFQGSIGGGTVTAFGGIDYRPDIRFDLGVSAKGVRMLYPQGLRESVDADLRFNGSTDYAVLGGSVNLTNISFTPGFDLTSFIANLSGGVASPPSLGFSQRVKLNLAVHSTNNIDLVSRTLSVDGSANLQVRGTAAEPVILGRVNLTDGDIILNGDRFVLTGGTVQFVNPSRTEPVLNVALTTTIQQYDINLRFSGPVEQMRSEYTSNPSLPPADIIHLLAFGQTSEAAANNPTPANQAAESLVASQVSSQVTSRVAKVAGISQLSINPVLSGNSEQGPPGAQITIQQRVTGNLFITFTTNVATTQDETIQGQYRLSPRVSISVTRDPNGGFAVDTLIKKTW